MSEIIIHYAFINEPLPSVIYKEYLALLPPDAAAKNKKFKFWKDQHAHLFGKILLKRALEEHAGSFYDLFDIKLTQYHKPYITKEFDFNISHSRDLIVLAFAFDNLVGIDVELIRDIPLDDFKSTMSSAQWSIIQNSSHPSKAFFRFWTIKESIVKAMGCGLNFPLAKIEPENNAFSHKGKDWFFYPVDIGKQGYTTCLASLAKDPVILLKEHVFGQF